MRQYNKLRDSLFKEKNDPCPLRDQSNTRKIWPVYLNNKSQSSPRWIHPNVSNAYKDPENLLPRVIRYPHRLQRTKIQTFLTMYAIWDPCTFDESDAMSHSPLHIPLSNAQNRASLQRQPPRSVLAHQKFFNSLGTSSWALSIGLKESSGIPCQRTTTTRPSSVFLRRIRRCSEIPVSDENTCDITAALSSVSSL